MCFLFAVGSVCSQSGSQLGGRHFAENEEVEMEVWKWLRQQSKRLLCGEFRRNGKAMGQVYSLLVEDMLRNKWFCQARISHVLHFISICDLFTDSPYNFFFSNSGSGFCNPVPWPRSFKN
jgi:hypothetical protein